MYSTEFIYKFIISFWPFTALVIFDDTQISMTPMTLRKRKWIRYHYTSFILRLRWVIETLEYLDDVKKYIRSFLDSLILKSEKNALNIKKILHMFVDDKNLSFDLPNY